MLSSVGLWIFATRFAHARGVLPDAALNICPELRTFIRLGEVILTHPRYDSE
jgi:hypothetical protein